ncbi:integrase [Corallococcus sp. AB030]|uniref:tyrosine-type recombinase/integrase n=1 Tax=Corallococcus TaxID=83461 RepID=UPI000EA1A35E|nr:MULTISPECIES: tyrosine-type recombinase/integrase [Corallococcus]RKH28336.1 integrase [Corallococcus sp. CA041A]RKI05822.1 integrase [Corallococcus sp. AB030]
MISDYFEAPWRLAQMRATCVGPYIDGFSTALSEAGYSPFTIRGYLRAADHVGRWADRSGIDIKSWGDDTLMRFGRHLPRCKCIKGNKGIFSDALAGVRLLLAHLRASEVIAAAKPTPTTPKYAPISERFADWMVRHRGVAPSTTARYQRTLQPFLGALGDDPGPYTVAAIRAFVSDQLGDVGRDETRSAVTSIRAFLRFLVAEGRVHSGIQHCVPTVPQWRLSSLPRYLEAPDVERVVQSCDLTTGHGLRDHAILLLLARLGLRAGDIVGMTVTDIDWRGGTLRVHGKGRREVRLPLPQDVGDAVLAYLERGRPRASSDRLFLTVYAPTRPFATSATVSDIVRVALERAEIQNPPSRGAHLLRHSAATAMLRAGSSLDTIATVLRHRSPETTAYYAKVDVAMLQQVAQPWPGGAAC